jgi:hypothetical protein
MVPISGDVLASLFTAGNDVGVCVNHDIPKGSRLMAIHYDARSNTFFVKFQHHSFEKIDQGNLFPLVKPMAVHMFDLSEEQKRANATSFAQAASASSSPSASPSPSTETDQTS